MNTHFMHILRSMDLKVDNRMLFWHIPLGCRGSEITLECIFYICFYKIPITFLHLPTFLHTDTKSHSDIIYRFTSIRVCICFRGIIYNAEAAGRSQYHQKRSIGVGSGRWEWGCCTASTAQWRVFHWLVERTAGSRDNLVLCTPGRKEQKNAWPYLAHHYDKGLRLASGPQRAHRHYHYHPPQLPPRHFTSSHHAAYLGTDR